MAPYPAPQAPAAMPAVAARTLTLTPQEYFEWETTQDVRHEYHFGEVYPVPGGTFAQATLIANLTAALGVALRGTDCRTVSGAMLGEFVHDHPPAQKHDHVILHMEGGARITFNDARRFGFMDLMPTEAQDAHPLIALLGPEPLGNAFSGAVLADALAGKRTPMKAALLDQTVVAGLGNIYVCEALHRAGVSPRRQARNLSRARAEALVPVIRDVLEEAIEAGGSSLRDHRQATGELGYFQHAFRAYGREGAPCPNACGHAIRRIVQSGRSTFYCPACQR